MRWAIAHNMFSPIWCLCVAWRWAWGWGAWVCLRQGCIPKDLWCWRASVPFRDCIWHILHTNGITCNILTGNGRRLFETGFIFFVTFWFLWCLIPTGHGTQIPTGSWPKVSLGSGDAWAMLEWAGRGEAGVHWWGETRWHLSEPSRLHASIHSEHFWPVAHKLILPHLSFPPSSSISAFSQRCCCCCCWVPEWQVITPGTSLAALPSAPADRNPGFSYWGLRTVRFFLIRNVFQEIIGLQLFCIENAL